MFRSTAMRYLPFVLVLAACESSVPTTTIAQVPFAADSGDIAIRCGMLIDGLGDETSTDRLVVIRNGRFELIAPGNASAGIRDAVLAGVDTLEYASLLDDMEVMKTDDD